MELATTHANIAGVPGDICRLDAIGDGDMLRQTEKKSEHITALLAWSIRLIEAIGCERVLANHRADKADTRHGDKE